MSDAVRHRNTTSPEGPVPPHADGKRPVVFNPSAKKFRAPQGGENPRQVLQYPPDRRIWEFPILPGSIMSPSILLDASHRQALAANARAQITFFRASVNAQGGFDILDAAGRPLAGQPQELHTTTRLVHSFALASAWGNSADDAVLDAGLHALSSWHRDAVHGGYAWAVDGNRIVTPTKLAYGHVFVLLAATSACAIGHDGGPRLLADIEQVLERHFWDDDVGRLREEFNRDWSPFSSYRGMNANMHGTEAFLAAFEVTGDPRWLDRAGHILDFFVTQMAARNAWRIPEHYTADWLPDPDYRGDPMFRPAGTTPGHALEFARLLLQHWDLAGRVDAAAPERARALVLTALHDAWLPEGGLAYTVDQAGKVLVADRYWWPVTEGMGALAALLKLGNDPEIAQWYLRLWDFAQAAFVDHDNGGWHPEIDAKGQPCGRQFSGKPDIYHALQAMLYPLVPTLSRPFAALRDLPIRF